MISSKEFVGAFERNTSLVHSQTEGLGHADSLIQPPVRGNCMNWVLGHILDSRQGLLAAFGCEPIVGASLGERYGYGSEPVKEDSEGVLRLEELVGAIDESQSTLASVLRKRDEASFSELRDTFMGSVPLSRFVFFMYFHETYHVGQLELLRQLAGTDDAVI